MEDILEEEFSLNLCKDILLEVILPILSQVSLLILQTNPSL